jgi:hypothetical protein
MIMKKLIGLIAVVAMISGAALAVTNDVSVGSGALPAGRPGPVWITLPLVDTVAINATAADYFTVMTIPAGAIVHSVMYHATTIAGATCTVDIGDTGSDTRFVTAGDMETVTNWTIIASASVSGVYYTTANALRVQFNHTTAVCKMQVRALVSMP